MVYSEAVAQVAAEASVAAKRSKKACGGGDQEGDQQLWRCGNCGGTEHDAQTCRKIQRHLLNQMQARCT
jgi:hypothetical protein